MAANNISLAELYKAALDRIYLMGARSAILEGNNAYIRPSDNPKVIWIARQSLQGLGDYSRADGYVSGDITLEWDPYSLEYDRGRLFQVDEMDNTEALDLPLLNLVAQFMDEYVTPEIDALRFAKIANQAWNMESLYFNAADEAIAAWDVALETLDNAEVPQENRHVFMSVRMYHMLRRDKVERERLVPAQSSDSNFDTLDGINITIVPPARFFSGIQLLSGMDGEAQGGFVKGADETPLNFLLVHLPAVSAVTKHAIPRIFGPTVNQRANATQFDYRIYHDIFVPTNKAPAIYAHKE
ncbi:MAG: hypothetical protein FWF99_00095 [Desulfovibrionaceae bacterium]|nr:hypothetical protein [Desulfovibrionaceae bacterium]